MSYYHRSLHESRIIAKEEAKRLQREKMKRNRVELINQFYKDITAQTHQTTRHMVKRLNERKKALVKAGYITENDEVTDLGFEKLIAHMVKQVKSNFNIK